MDARATLGYVNLKVLLTCGNLRASMVDLAIQQ
jgi:hypothetical protein